MIGIQPTGAIDGVIISAVASQGLQVTVDGRPGRLAIVDETGQVISSGEMVAREALAVAVNCYRNVLQCKGHERVQSAQIPPSTAAT